MTPARAYRNDLRRRRVARGLCARCNGRACPGLLLCARHVDAAAAYNRQSYARRKAAALLAAAVLLVAAPVDAGHALAGKATRFADVGDRWRGGKSPCLGRRVEHTDWGIAHRTLPCGARVLITNRRTGRMAIAPVITRGPYGAAQPDGSWAIKRRPSDPGVWRGVVDLTPPVFRALDAKSFDRVTLEVL